jgi:hypothetical protein
MKIVGSAPDVVAVTLNSPRTRGVLIGVARQHGTNSLVAPSKGITTQAQHQNEGNQINKFFPHNINPPSNKLRLRIKNPVFRPHTKTLLVVIGNHVRFFVLNFSIFYSAPAGDNCHLTISKILNTDVLLSFCVVNLTFTGL